jgi:hypothetical protein
MPPDACNQMQPFAGNAKLGALPAGNFKVGARVVDDQSSLNKVVFKILLNYSLNSVDYAINSAFSSFFFDVPHVLIKFSA